MEWLLLTCSDELKNALPLPGQELYVSDYKWKAPDEELVNLSESVLFNLAFDETALKVTNFNRFC